MTQDEIIEMVHQASKLWLKEYPAPADCANPVPKRYLEIFAKLVASAASAKEREACIAIAESKRHAPNFALTSMPPQNGTAVAISNAIRARAKAERGEA